MKLGPAGVIEPISRMIADVRAATADALARGPLPQGRAAVAGVALVLAAGILALRIADPEPGDAVLILLLAPIMLCAIEFGTAGGIVAALFGFVLVGVADILGGFGFGPLGYLSRGGSFLAVGGLLGRFVNSQRALEREVRRAEELSLDLIATAGFDGYFKRLNPAWRKLGYSHAELRARPFIEFVHPDDRQRTLAEAAKLANVGTDTVSFRNRYCARDGSFRWLEWNARAVADEQLIYALARDITDRVRADELATAAQAEAERANRTKSEFLSRMSHELRTPLNAILGFGQLLEMEHDLTPLQRESAERIVRAGRHLLELINEVLDISRIESGTLSVSMEPVDVVSGVQDVLSIIAPLAEDRGITLVTELSAPAYAFALADRQRLRQVLLNLLANGVKYNRPGGSVRVAVHGSGERLRIDVHDSGEGIPAGQLERLFQPFERLGVEATGVEGTGLGLALSKNLVEAMGGRIGVHSEVGVGSTFFVELQRAADPASADALDDARRAGAGSATGVGAATLLYVEDNLSNLRLIEHIFAARPEVKLLSAMQGGLGLELARTHRPDLILLDLHLADMPGERVLSGLRDDAATHDIPVVVLSADATPRQVERLLESGAAAYLTKPLDVERFLATVGDLLEVGNAAR